MFILEFLNNLQQNPINSPWLTHLMNQNFKMRFCQQCDYLFKFQVGKKINESILQQKWPRNNFDIEKNPYNSHLLAYSREMD
jgi:hypothetical protein